MSDPRNLKSPPSQSFSVGGKSPRTSAGDRRHGQQNGARTAAVPSKKASHSFDTPHTIVNVDFRDQESLTVVRRMPPRATTIVGNLSTEWPYCGTEHQTGRERNYIRTTCFLLPHFAGGSKVSSKEQYVCTFVHLIASSPKQRYSSISLAAE